MERLAGNLLGERGGGRGGGTTPASESTLYFPILALRTSTSPFSFFFVLGSQQRGPFKSPRLRPAGFFPGWVGAKGGTDSPSGSERETEGGGRETFFFFGSRHVLFPPAASLGACVRRARAEAKMACTRAPAHSRPSCVCAIQLL